MAHEFNSDPWKKTPAYRDRTYPSGVARERPKLTTRIHCEADEGDGTKSEDVVSGSGNRVQMFNEALRSGHGFRNEGDE